MFVQSRRLSSYRRSYRSKMYFLGALLWIFALSWAQSAVAEEVISIKKLNDNPGQYIDETVIVEGSVVELEEKPGALVKHYIIKGDDEATLRVRIQPQLGKPKLNVNYKVTGDIIPGTGGQMFLAETARTPLSTESPAATARAEQSAPIATTRAQTERTASARPRTMPHEEPEPVTGMKKLLYTVIIVTVPILVVLIIILYVVLKRRQTVAVSAKPIQETIKIDPAAGKAEIPEPDQGTVKLLPGYFEITSGVEGGGRFFVYASETTIGRGDTTGRDHISFPDDYASVSRSQAKLYYMSGKYTVKNLADPLTKNATAVNGESLSLEGSKTLDDGDKISFGEVEITYHAKR